MFRRFLSIVSKLGSPFPRKWKKLAVLVLDSLTFRFLLVISMILSGVIAGVQIYPEFYKKHFFHFFQLEAIIFSVFLFEIILKIIKYWPNYRKLMEFWFIYNSIIFLYYYLLLRQYFQTYNPLFNIGTAVQSDIIIYLMFARLLNLIRLFEGYSKFKIIWKAIIRVLPSIIKVVLILLIIFYVYSILTTILFGKYSPEKFGTPWSSLETLYYVMFNSWVDLYSDRGIYDFLNNGYFPKWGFVMIFLSFQFLSALVLLNFFIGLITSDLGMVRESERRGKIKINSRKHILILGWNENIFSIIEELNKTKFLKTKVVILADKDKAEMDYEIEQRFKTLDTTKIFTIRGNVTKVDDLKLANAWKSNSIIVLNEGNNIVGDLKILKTIYALQSNLDVDINKPYETFAKNLTFSKIIRVGFNPFETILYFESLVYNLKTLALELIYSPNSSRKLNFNIIPEIQNSIVYEKIREIDRKENLIIFNTEKIITNLIINAIFNPGITEIYSEILGLGDNRFVILEDKKFVGKNYKETLLMFNDSCLVGYINKNGKCIFNPPPTYKFQENDKLVFISDKISKIVSKPKQKQYIPFSSEEVKREFFYEREEIFAEYIFFGKILIIGYSPKIPEIISGLILQQSNLGFDFKICLSNEDEESKLKIALAEKFKDLKAQKFNVEFYKENELEQLLKDIEKVIILANLSRFATKTEADTHNLYVLSRLHKYKGFGTSIVAEFFDDENARLVRGEHYLDCIVHSNLIGPASAQLAQQKELINVFDTLFDGKVGHIGVYSVKDFFGQDYDPFYISEIRFGEIVATGIQMNETAIGVIVDDYSRTWKNKVLINPPKDERIIFGRLKGIIVIS